jgi:hypothetical protein
MRHFLIKNMDCLRHNENLKVFGENKRGESI